MTKKEIKALSDQELLEQINKVKEYEAEQYPKGLGNCRTTEHVKAYIEVLNDFVNLIDERNKRGII